MLKVAYVACGLALVVPLLAAMCQCINAKILLFFWPGSLLLLPLNTGAVAWTKVLIIWAVAIATNLLLYNLVALIGYALFRSTGSKLED